MAKTKNELECGICGHIAGAPFTLRSHINNVHGVQNTNIPKDLEVTVSPKGKRVVKRKK